MKSILNVVLILLVVFSCNELKNDKSPPYQNRENNRVKDFVIIEIGSTNSMMFKGLKPAKLNRNEIATINNLIINCVKEYNSDRQYNKDDSEYLNLPNYKRQYVPYYNKDGEKEVWVNFYSGSFEGLNQKEILTVDDGGNTYFQLNINLNKKRCEDLSVNGVA